MAEKAYTVYQVLSRTLDLALSPVGNLTRLEVIELLEGDLEGRKEVAQELIAQDGPVGTGKSQKELAGVLEQLIAVEYPTKE